MEEFDLVQGPSLVHYDIPENISLWQEGLLAVRV